MLGIGVLNGGLGCGCGSTRGRWVGKDKLKVVVIAVGDEIDVACWRCIVGVRLEQSAVESIFQYIAISENRVSYQDG